MKKWYYFSAADTIDITILKQILNLGFNFPYHVEVISTKQVAIEADESLTIFLEGILPSLNQDLGVSLYVLITHKLSPIMSQSGRYMVTKQYDPLLHLGELLLLLIIDQQQGMLTLFKKEFSTIPRDLYLTASSYIRSGLNATKASEKLYVHRNTFNYRLQQFIAVTQLDIRDHFHALYFNIIEKLMTH
jgi:hypothetical protein